MDETARFAVVVLPNGERFIEAIPSHYELGSTIESVDSTGEPVSGRIESIHNSYRDAQGAAGREAPDL
mgnify:FL=1